MPNLAQSLFDFSILAAFHREDYCPHRPLVQLVFTLAAEGKTECVQPIRDLEALSYFPKGEAETAIPFFRSKGFDAKIENEKLMISWKKSFL